jgi:RimJ/RimL family protein N-acetyltransferase
MNLKTIVHKREVPAPQSLIGKKTYLRPATAEDIQNTYHWTLLSEPQSLTSRPRLLLTASEAAERFRKQEPTIERQTFMIVRQDDNTPVGRISFFNYNHLNRSAEIGIIIDPDERRKGHATDGIRTLCRYLFMYRGLNKVVMETAENNKGMTKVAEGLRFKLDGTLRDQFLAHGEFIREFIPGKVYSLLRYEFEQ